MDRKDCDNGEGASFLIGWTTLHTLSSRSGRFCLLSSEHCSPIRASCSACTSGHSPAEWSNTEQTPEGDVEEVEIDQNDNEVEEDEYGKITEQARNLKTLNQYQQNILRLQNEKEQLLRLAAGHNRAKQMQRAIKEAEI